MSVAVNREDHAADRGKRNQQPVVSVHRAVKTIREMSEMSFESLLWIPSSLTFIVSASLSFIPFVSFKQLKTESVLCVLSFWTYYFFWRTHKHARTHSHSRNSDFNTKQRWRRLKTNVFNEKQKTTSKESSTKNVRWKRKRKQFMWNKMKIKYKYIQEIK